MADFTFNDGVAATSSTSVGVHIADISEVLLALGLSGSVTEQERAIASNALTRAEGAVKKYLKYDPTQRERTEYYPQSDFNLQSRTSIWEVQGNLAIQRKRSEAANDELQIQHIPIRSVTSLFVDYDGRNDTRSGAFPAETEKTEGVDFWPNYDGIDGSNDKICRDGIIRSIGAWATTPGSVKIVYVGGYTSDELHGEGGVIDASPISEVVVSEAVRRAKKAFLQLKTSRGFFPGPLTGERLGDYQWRADEAISGRLYGGEWDLMPDSQSQLDLFVNWGWEY